MIEIPDNEVQVSFSHSSGPGGQNINKTKSCSFTKEKCFKFQIKRPEVNLTTEDVL
jgi:protein subunit release factor B